MTSEQIELVVKLIAVLASVVAVYKAFQEIVLSRKPRLREEFAFVKSFVSELKDDTHPFLVEKGFLAISGDPTLSAAEIRYLLSLDSPSTALRRYLYAREHLVFSPRNEEGKKRIDFKPAFASEKSRNLRKALYLASYAVTAFLALAPLLFARSLFGANWKIGLLSAAMLLLSFGWIAISSLSSASKIWRAEELVKQQ